MPIVNTAPVLVDPLTYSRSFLGTDHFGPYELNGALYLVLADAQLAAPHYATVYKSTDDGLTWTIPDAANRGVLISSSFPGGSIFVVGSIITLFYSANFGAGPTSVQWITFDTASDTYGPAQDISILSPSVDVNGFYARPRSNGNIVFAFARDLTLGNWEVDYSEYNGVSWSAYVQVSTNIASNKRATLNGLHIEPDDTVSIIYSATFSTPRGSYYRSLSPANVLGAIVTIDLDGATIINHWSNEWLVFGGKFYIACGYAVLGIASPAFVVSDALTPTSFSIVMASADTIGGDIVAVLGSDALFYIFFIHTLYSGTLEVLEDQIRQITSADLATFSASAVYYDNLLDPPVPNPTPPEDQFLHTLSVTELAAGGFGLGTALEYVDAPVNACAGYYLGAGEPAPPVVPVVPNIPPGGVASGFTGFAPCAPAARARRTYRPWIPPSRRKNPCS